MVNKSSHISNFEEEEEEEKLFLINIFKSSMYIYD